MVDGGPRAGGGRVELVALRRQFGEHVAVDGIDLDIPGGEFFSLLGPSGCGKTTTLRMIAGFEPPTSGQILLDGVDMAHTPAHKRPVNTVFQSYALFPHLTVERNVAYGLRWRRDLSKQEKEGRLRQALALVRLEQLAERKPHQMSGGQQQRVALARALILSPRVLLLDEPLGALDAKLRTSLRSELTSLQREVGITFVFVTHDQGEALGLANRIAVMKDGRIEQLGTPEEIYLTPATHFIAGFIGEANLLKAERKGGRIAAACGIACSHAGSDGPVTLVVRPESARRLADSDHADVEIAGTVEEVVFLGAHVKYVLALPGGEKLRVQEPVEHARVALGETMRVGWSSLAQRVLA